MNITSNFGSGDILLFMLEFFLFMIWFWLLITIFGDLFRDRELSGVLKAVWVVALLFMPFLGILLYLIIRGSGMTDRAAAARADAQKQFDAQVKAAAGTQSPADQIASAKALLDSGAISQPEFEALKAKALG